MGSALLKMRRTHMMRRVLALAVACLMLSGCGPVRTEPWDNEVAQTDGPEIAYVPLDGPTRQCGAGSISGGVPGLYPEYTGER